MEVNKNQQGQTIVRLSHSEWKQYGEQAGFLEKDAIAVERGTLDGMTDEQKQKAQEHLESLRRSIQVMTDELMEASQAFADDKITYFEENRPMQSLDQSLQEGNIEASNIPVGKHNHISDEEFDQKELEMGINLEYEHTDDYQIAKAIAKDHLAECSTYYTRLARMEEKCEDEEEDLEGDICLMTSDALTQASSVNINKKTDTSPSLKSVEEQTGMLPPFDKTSGAV